MNKVFKVIWSKTKSCFIVVSEIARRDCRAAGTGVRRTAAVMAALSFLFIGGASAVLAADPADDTNVVQGTNNKTSNVSYVYITGSDNDVADSSHLILLGDGYSGYFKLSGVQDSVIIGKSSSTIAGYVPFDKVKNVVSLGNGNVLSSTDGAVAIGNDNFMKRTGAESFGYDTGNVAIGNNTYINSYVNQGDSIVIGKNATAVNMNGSLEKAFAFGTKEGKDYSGSIAIGQNAYARSGSTMIGVHNYWGRLGDLDINYEKGNEGGEGPAHIAAYQESTNATTVGNNSYNNGVFSTVMGSYTAVSGFYHNQKWGEKPYGMQNFGAAVIGSLNSVEGLSSPDHNTAGMADSILGSANRTQNANGTVMVGAGNVVTNSVKDFDATGIKTKVGIESPNALSEAMRKSIKDANGGGAAAVVGNANTISDSTKVSVLGSGNSVTGTDKAQILGDSRTASDADGSVIIGSADSNLTTKVKNATVIGYNANVEKEGGVAMGAGSIASVDKGAVGYDPTKADHKEDATGVWKSTAAAVSVGKAAEKDKTGNVTSQAITRQITNLAAGTEDTDAVNVAQLKSARTHFYSVNSSDTKAGNYNNNGAAGVNALAAGVNAEAVLDRTIAIGDGAYAQSADSVAIGTGVWVSASNGSKVNGGDVAIGQNAHIDSYVDQGGQHCYRPEGSCRKYVWKLRKEFCFWPDRIRCKQHSLNPKQ